MSKFFVNQNQINNNIISIQGQDVNHIKNVLRYQLGDSIVVCDNDTSTNYKCEIISIDKDSINCKIIEQLDSSTESNIKLTVFQGLPKADKMELIIQKGTELGISTFVPVSMKRSIVKLDSKDASKKQTRWQTIAEVASKQCGRDLIPQVESVITFKQLLDRCNDFDLTILAYEQEKQLSIKQVLEQLKFGSKYKNKEHINIAFIVGPEGGIDDQEAIQLQDKNVQVVTLGKRILRTETAPLALASIIMYELEN